MPIDRDRPDPDSLLQSVNRAEAKINRGKLKIFLGMAAGVGKTYAMLQQAHSLQKKEDIDLVVGIVETHGRQETASLLVGLAIIPKKQISYRHVILEEMDLDAIIARKPQLVLVDELAHTNAPECRHTKRYQDVQEILDLGINVWTTLNVQHLESRADTVQDITGVRVSETLPDSILSQADEIILIDLPPEELLQRLKEGKVYTPDKAADAVRNFFQIGHLTALREMALRVTAVQVDQNLVDIRRLEQINVQWKASDRLMVAVYASPFSERLIRWTKRAADAMNAAWFGVYVDTGNPLSDLEQNLLAKNLAIVQELGGEVAMTADDDPVKGLLRLAHQNNISLIVVGRSRRSFLYNFRRGGSLVNRLLRETSDIDLYVVTAESPPEKPAAFTLGKKSLDHLGRDLGIISIITALVTVVAYAVIPSIEYQTVGLLFLLEVTILSLYVEWIGTFASALISGLVWDFFFMPPRYTLEIRKPADIVMLFTYFVVAAVTGYLTYRLRRQQRLDNEREKRTSGLYHLTRELSSARSMDDLLHSAVPRIKETFDADVAIVLSSSQNNDKIIVHPSSTSSLDIKEMSVAAWVYEHGRPAGRFTDTLPSAKYIYFPLISEKKTLGVMGLCPRFTGRFSAEAQGLAEVFGKQLAIGLEREELHESAKKVLVAQESERLSAALINCVSHELKTPLASIVGASSAILEPNLIKDVSSVKSFVEQIHDGAQRLTRLVENLLDMSRIESGGIKLHKQDVDLKELVGVVLRRFNSELAGKFVRLNFADNLPLVPADMHLIEQVIGNIIHNAVIHTPKQSRLEISGRTENNTIFLTISDDGPGLPSDNEEKIFEKFFRADPTRPGNTGLGLAIARGFVEIHGGTLIARNRHSGGAEFIIKLPLG